MSKVPKEDLFEGSTMTFGEHLDELRVALFKSLVGLVVGFLIGLLVAKYVVHAITVPLKNALDVHYETVAEEELIHRYGDNLPKDLMTFMKDERLMFDEVYIERKELERLAVGEESGVEELASDANLDKIQLPLPDRHMVKTRIWRKTNANVQALGTQEPFMIWLKAAFFSGLLIASPYIFWQIWAFVAAGLYPTRSATYISSCRSASCCSGPARCWHSSLPSTMCSDSCSASIGHLNIQAEPRISEWIGFVLISSAWASASHFNCRWSCSS